MKGSPGAFASGSPSHALADKWPDDITRKLLAERAGVEGFAASLLGGWHSRFGRILFTRDLDGVNPYLDPAKPVSRDQIERAAERAQFPADRVDETVRSLSTHMGWDIEKGAGHDGEGDNHRQPTA